MRFRPESGLLLGVLVLAVSAGGFDLVLMRQNANLRATVARLQGGIQMSQGATVGSIMGEDLSKRPRIVTFRNGSTLLLIFSPFCHFCDLNWPTWRALIASAREDRVSVIGVDLSGMATNGYLIQRGVPGLDVLTGLSFQEMSAYKFLATPQTVLVGKGGAVKLIFTGPIDNRELRVMTAALRLN